MQIPVNATPEEIKRAFDQLGAIVLGRLLTLKTIGTSKTTIAHGLGRVPKGWIPVSPQNGAASPAESASPDATNLYLIASSPVTASLWVF